MSTKTRSNKMKNHTDEKSTWKKVAALRKVFFFDSLLQSETLKLKMFYHPGYECKTLFAIHANKTIFEVLEFDEVRRSWLIDNSVSSDGRIYMTSPLDVTFFALHYLRKHCARHALELDSIHEEGDNKVGQLLSTFVDPSTLGCVSDVKTLGDMRFYKYNPTKALAWLAIKTRRLALVLLTTGVHCGHSARSQNYIHTQTDEEELLSEGNYMRLACDLIGGYIDLELHEELINYLEIPAKIQPKVEESKLSASKRKKLPALRVDNNKKCKMDEDETNTRWDDSLEESLTKETIKRPIERTLTTKEKELAKSARGTKSIASFFKA